MKTTSNVALGQSFALVAAASFGFITTFTRLAYNGGSNPVTVMLLRFAIAILVIGLLLKVLGRAWRIPRGRWLIVGVVALCSTITTVGHMWAVLFIPVSLAAIIFYIFPLMVAAVVVCTDRSAISTLGLVAFPLAFVGLALVIGPSFDVLDWRGVALALLGALAAATTTVVSARVVREVNELALALCVNVVGVLLMCMLLPLFGGLVLPTLLSGWFGTVGVGVCAVGGISLIFVAIRYAGPARSALFLNFEPIVIIAAAAAILGERLAPVQLLGAACVVGALLLGSSPHSAPRRTSARAKVHRAQRVKERE